MDFVKTQYNKIYKEKVSDFCSFVNSNLKYIFVIILLAIFTYGFEMTNYTLSVDEELLWGYDLYIEQGRFGIAILKILFGSIPIISTQNTMLSIFFLVLAVLVVSWEISKFTTKNLSWLIFACFFLTFPFNADYIRFSTYNFEVSFGIFCASLAICSIIEYLIFSKSKIYAIFGILLLTFSISIYQSFTTYCLTGVALFLFMHSYNNKVNLKEVIMKIFVIFIASLGLYFAINRFLLIIFDLTVSSYITTFIHWFDGDISVVISNLLLYLKNAITGNFAYFLITMPITFALDVALFIYIIVNKKHRNLASILFFILLNISPFIINIVIGGMTPLRSYHSLTFLVAAIWMLSYVYLILPIMKKPFIFMTIILVMSQAQLTNQLLFSDYVQLQQDTILATKISMQIEELGLGESPDIPVVFVGKHPTKNTPTEEIFGEAENPYSSFFERGNDRNYRFNVRLNGFFANLGYNYMIPTEEQIEDASILALDMPFWPNAGSVAVKNNMIIVNLSLEDNISYESYPINETIDYNLEPVNTEIANYSIDEIQNSSNILNIKGWAFIGANDSINSEVFLELKSENNTYIYDTTPMIRHDVEWTFPDEPKDLTASGFYCSIDKSTIEPGHYTIGIYIENEFTCAYKDTGIFADIP